MNLAHEISKEIARIFEEAGNRQTAQMAGRKSRTSSRISQSMEGYESGEVSGISTELASSERMAPDQAKTEKESPEGQNLARRICREIPKTATGQSSEKARPNYGNIQGNVRSTETQVRDLQEKGKGVNSCSFH